MIKPEIFIAAKSLAPKIFEPVMLRGTFRGNSSVLRRRERCLYGLLINNSRRFTAV
jgi:hypothetical protein